MSTVFHLRKKITSQGQGYILRVSITFAVLSTLSGCARSTEGVRTFADYPGFEEYYGKRCADGSDHVSPEKGDRELLHRYRPKVILPPGGRYPIDFYRDYLPYTVMKRHSDGEVVAEQVSPEMLKEHKGNREVYLDFKEERFRMAGRGKRVEKGGEKISPGKKPALYGRVYREEVPFPCDGDEPCSRILTFLKYNIVFQASGLAAKLPRGYEFTLNILGLDPEDWHELDNFVAAHVVLNDRYEPLAVMVAQHNHHRTYLVGRDIILSPEGRPAFDVALRSNEIYPASDSEAPGEHRVVQWSIYMKYLLSGRDPPRYRGLDITRGINAGGVEVDYDLKFLSPCDPFYTAEMMLGEPRPFFGSYIGRDGPPGSDYYTVPPLLPLGNLLKFSYLRDGDREDIALVEEAIDVKGKRIDVDMVMEHGGRKFYRDVTRRGGSFTLAHSDKRLDNRKWQGKYPMGSPYVRPVRPLQHHHRYF